MPPRIERMMKIQNATMTMSGRTEKRTPPQFVVGGRPVISAAGFFSRMTRTNSGSSAGSHARKRVNVISRSFCTTVRGRASSPLTSRSMMSALAMLPASISCMSWVYETSRACERP